MLKDKINEYLAYKSILILGFGKEGISTYNYIQKHNIPYTKICIADKNINIEKKDGVEYILGEDYLNSLSSFDVILKSPGISLKDIDIEDFKDRIVSQTELFLKFGREKVVGITGTKGKSTTTSMIYELLKRKYEVEIVGNFGIPVFEYVDKFESIDYFVYELSAHQLEMVDVSPKIAIFLNIYEEHLDYYVSYEKYIDAKRNIFRYQDEKSYVIYNKEMEKLIFADNVVKAKKIPVNPKRTYNTKLNIYGEHNKYNFEVATNVAKILNVDKDIIDKVCVSFKALPHRLENIGEFSCVTYIDDSISTIPEAAISALKSIPSVNTILIGGMDRGINYDILVDYLAEATALNVIFMYETGKKIYDIMLKRIVKCNIMYAEDLERAVALAVNVTKKDSVCLLSPAAASYGYFKNFEERGDKFKEYVEAYAKR